MKMKIIFCVITSLFPISFGYAQDSTHAEIPTSVFIQLEGMAGYLKNDNASLNKSLVGAGLKTFSENVLGRTLAVKFSVNKAFLKKVIFAFAIDSYSLDGDDDTYRSTLGGTGIEPSIGYIVLAKKDFHLYPYVGFSLNHSKLEYTRLDTSAIQDIGDIINVTTKEGVINFVNKAVDLGLCAEKIFKARTIGSCPRNVRFFSVAIRAGYLFKLDNTNNGSYHYKEVPNGPNFGLGGPYVKLSLGYGVRLRKLKWS